MMIEEKLDVSDQFFASGPYADVRRGRYEGHYVAVRTLRVGGGDDIRKIRKVRTKDIFAGT